MSARTGHLVAGKDLLALISLAAALAAASLLPAGAPRTAAVLLPSFLAAGLALARPRGSGGGPAHLGAWAVLLAGLLVLSELPLLRTVPPPPDRLAAERELVEERFNALAARLDEALGGTFAPELDIEGERFAWLERRARGVSLALLEASDGSDLAWWGDATPIDPSLLEALPEGELLVLRRGLGLRLVAKRLDPVGRVLVAELALSPSGSELLPASRGGAVAGGRIRWLPAGERRAPRPPSRGARRVSFTLPTRGTPVAHVDLEISSEAELRAAKVRDARGRAALLAAGLALLLLARLRRPRGRRPGFLSLLLASGLLWSARLLAGRGLDRLEPSGALFDPLEYAGEAPLDLLGSPAALFLTGLALALQAALVLSWSERMLEGDSGRERSRWIALLATPMAVASLLGAVRLARRLAIDARPSLLSFRLLDLDVVRLALQGGLLSATLAALLVSALALRAGTRTLSGSALPGPSGLGGGALVRLVLLAAAFPYPFVAAADRRLEERQLVEDFALQVSEREERWAGALRSELERLERRAGPAGRPGISDDTALRLWRDSAPARSGLASGLLLFDEDGAERGRFLHRLPPALDLLPRSAGRRELRYESVESFTRRTELLVGETPLPDGGAALFLIERRPENLPFLTRADPLARALLEGESETGRHSLSLPLPSLAVFGPGGDLVFSSFPSPPTAPPASLERPARRRVSLEGEPWQLYDLPDPDAGTIVLGLAGLELRDHVAQLLRLCLVDLLLAGLVLGLGALALDPRLAWRGTARFLGSFRRSHERRLLAGILAAALVPLLTLAWFSRDYALSQAQRALTEEGLSAVRVARRVVEDFLTLETGSPETGDEDAATVLTDSMTHWLGEVIRQDLSLYVGGHLVASSRRDLFQAGVLGTRLPARVERELVIEGHSTIQESMQLGEQELPVVYGSLLLPEGAGRGVAAIPLAAARGGGYRRRVAEVDEVILLGTVATLLLLGAIAVRTARRMSDPIRRLVRATESVAGGDLGVRVSGPSAEEIGVLMDGFNRMAESLERQRYDLERRRRYIETILENATTGVVAVDSAGAIRTLNPAARDLLGLEAAGVGDDLASRLQGAGGLDSLARALRASLANEAGRAEAEGERQSGAGEDPRRLQAVVLPLEESGAASAGRVLLVEDVTETARSERLAAWAEMARRIAHEIKNPLTPVSLVVEHLRHLQEKGDPALLAALPGALDTIAGQVEELRKISAEFSSYARLPEMRPVPTDLGGFVRELTAPYAAAPPEGVTLRLEVTEGLPPVGVDERVLRRAVVNLLENALQAVGETGGEVSVLVDADPRREGWVRLRIRDEGAGMDTETLGRLFEPYFSTRDAGTGLGLPIARRAVEQHGGELTAESEPGRGTTMTLRLPPAPEGEGGAAGE